jgi:hypothetical protein
MGEEIQKEILKLITIVNKSILNLQLIQQKIGNQYCNASYTGSTMFLHHSILKGIRIVIITDWSVMFIKKPPV